MHLFRVIRLIGLCVVLGGVLFIGCSTRKPGATRPVVDSKPYNWETEGQIPPLDERTVRRVVDRVDTFEELGVDDSEVEAEDVAPEPIDATPPPIGVSPADPSIPMPTMPGYRVQVFATGDLESAETIRKEAEAATKFPAQIELIDGIYKVRVGSCASRPEAEKVLQYCRRVGYTDAWIVASPIPAPPRHAE